MHKQRMTKAERRVARAYATEIRADESHHKPLALSSTWLQEHQVSYMDYSKPASQTRLVVASGPVSCLQHWEKQCMMRVSRWKNRSPSPRTACRAQVRHSEVPQGWVRRQCCQYQPLEGTYQDTTVTRYSRSRPSTSRTPPGRRDFCGMMGCHAVSNVN
jgi:hypothetical protein